MPAERGRAAVAGAAGAPDGGASEDDDIDVTTTGGSGFTGMEGSSAGIELFFVISGGRVRSSPGACSDTARPLRGELVVAYLLTRSDVSKVRRLDARRVGVDDLHANAFAQSSVAGTGPGDEEGAPRA